VHAGESLDPGGPAVPGQRCLVEADVEHQIRLGLGGVAGEQVEGGLRVGQHPQRLRPPHVVGVGVAEGGGRGGGTVVEGGVEVLGVGGVQVGPHGRDPVGSGSPISTRRPSAARWRSEAGLGGIGLHALVAQERQGVPGPQPVQRLL